MPSINTPFATLSFVNVFTPRPRSEGAEAVYNCQLIFDEKQQKDPAYKALKDGCVAVAKAKWGPNVDLKKVGMPFRDAGEKDYEGYLPGYTFISPWTKNKPGVVDARRQPIFTPEDVWSGQLARANVNPFAWERNGKKGVSFGLNLLQIVKSEGRVRLDGRPTAESVFDDGAVAEDEASVF